ncbi:MAG: acetoin utilization protein AcuC [Candidatus Aenigmatarchaeota archaeon]
MIRILFFSSKEYFSYGFENHPFSRERYEETIKEMERRNLFDRENLKIIEPKRASEKILRLFHSQDYINIVKELSEKGEGYLDPDTPAFKGMFEVSSTVVGASVEAVERVLKGEADKSFNLVGGLHHAKRQGSSGFCIFNDVAIAISYALDKLKAKRIFYVDVDAHHGDGVFYSFYEDERVWIADIHQDGTTLFPGTGFEFEVGGGKAYGTKRNFSLPPYSGDKELMEALCKILEFGEKAEPEIILLQAGADGIKGDPLTQLQYSLKAHSKFVREINELAEKICEGKLIIFGGGGYNITNCKKAWSNALEILLK